MNVSRVIPLRNGLVFPVTPHRVKSRPLRAAEETPPAPSCLPLRRPNGDKLPILTPKQEHAIIWRILPQLVRAVPIFIFGMTLRQFGALFLTYALYRVTPLASADVNIPILDQISSFLGMPVLTLGGSALLYAGIWFRDDFSINFTLRKPNNFPRRFKSRLLWNLIRSIGYFFVSAPYSAFFLLNSLSRFINGDTSMGVMFLLMGLPAACLGVVFYLGGQLGKMPWDGSMIFRGLLTPEQERCLGVTWNERTGECYIAPPDEQAASAARPPQSTR